jgi:hypothetical protein
VFVDVTTSFNKQLRYPRDTEGWVVGLIDSGTIYIGISHSCHGNIQPSGCSRGLACLFTPATLEYPVDISGENLLGKKFGKLGVEFFIGSE